MIEKSSWIIVEFKLYMSIVLAMFLQFMASENKTYRLFVVLVSSTLLVAFAFVPAMIELINLLLSTIPKVAYKIEDGSKVATMLYASSALISIEFISILMRKLPEGISSYIKRAIGVNDDKK